MAGKIYVIGIGPGSLDHLTGQALRAITCSEVIVGYRLYIELVRDCIGNQQVVTSGMMQEEKRAREVIELAREGKTVALISSGDAGVYGMAGLIYELIEQSLLDIEVEVIPGITAVLAAAAELGAPLMQDFAVISLSDLMTPWETIRRRIHAAGEGDFVVGIYNPRSAKRQRQLVEAQEILLQYRSPSTPVGIIWNGTRPSQRKLVTTLLRIPFAEVDMFATLIIGNSETYESRGRIITPRGYLQRGHSAGERP